MAPRTAETQGMMEADSAVHKSHRHKARAEMVMQNLGRGGCPDGLINAYLLFGPHPSFDYILAHPSN